MRETIETTEITEKRESRFVRYARWFTLGLAGLVITAIQPIAAHHSLTAFETTTRITVIGKVAVLDWGNPHVIVEIDGSEADGGVKRWTVEMAGPAALTRAGWKSSDLRFGARITVIV